MRVTVCPLLWAMSSNREMRPSTMAWRSTRGLRDWYAARYGADWLERLDAAVAACERDNGEGR